ncbi:plastocyanin/azurin family copper-binding protein [Haloarcula rubripromontorii]|uniref:Halocyanin n=1 Tax=Haloarcula rubripromontorii TaxID=1705562 RepID=A0A0N0BPZ1_9EURY|nr:plastocyanin/azurin family copper-binding protein [Haloarcula rubripromontorii]KOX94666.1 halocyanin [Haloarcula rubripromontorii]NLV07619.1 halocyanin [Haloarcula rubripromontorii]
MDQNRRQFLGALTAVVTGTIAGCSGGDSEDPSPTETATATQVPTRTATATSADSVTTPTETATPTDTLTETETPTATPTPTETPVDADQEVAVAPGDFVFDPETFEIPVGSTVLWVWEGGGHNVKPTATPEDSDWSGTPGDGTYSSGYQYAHTFAVPGEYEYHCVPHQSLGMTGSFTVTE